MTVTEFASNGIAQPTYGLIHTPIAVYYHGRTYLTWQGGSGLDPYVTYYDHFTGQWGLPVKAGNNPLVADDHGCSSICVDGNGRIHVFFGCHNSNMKHVSSVNPEDIGSWNNLADPATNATYPHAVAEGVNIYLLYRKSPNNDEAIRISADNGQTWGPEIILIQAALGELTYVGGVEQDGTRIHLGWTKSLPWPIGQRFNIYHAYLNLADMNLYSMNGVNLGATITPAEAAANCLVTNTGAFTTNQPALHIFSGRPYLIYPIDSAGGYRFEFKYWTGLTWSPAQTIAATGHQFNYSDFIVRDRDNIEAYLTISAAGVLGGDIQKWVYDGIGWVLESTVAFEAAYPLNFAAIPLMFKEELKLMFCETNAGDYGIWNLKIFSYGVFPTQWPSLHWDSEETIVSKTGLLGEQFIGDAVPSNMSRRVKELTIRNRGVEDTVLSLVEAFGNVVMKTILVQAHSTHVLSSEDGVMLQSGKRATVRSSQVNDGGLYVTASGIQILN